MTNLKAYRTQTRELFCEPLAKRGFFPKGSYTQFSRNKGSVVQSISFPGRWSYRANCYVFSIYFGIEYIALKRLYKPLEGEQFLQSVADSIDGLWEENGYTEWRLDAPSTLLEVLDQIDEYGIAFFETYSDFTNLKQRLDSPDPRCFTLSPETRVCLRAAIMAYEGQPAEALKMVDDALEQRKAAMPKYQFALQELRSRLIAMQGSEGR